MGKLFSQRYGVTPTPKSLIHEDVPYKARVGLCNLLIECENSLNSKYQGYNAHRSVYFDICKYLRILPSTEKPGVSQVEEHYHNKLNDLVVTCKYWQFYNICEIILGFLIIKTRKEVFSKKVNKLFKEECLGYELRDGKVEKVGSAYIDAEIKEARYLLKEPEFKGADTQFEKAIKALNIRPNPDVENCVKDAVGAIESVGRIIAHNDKALLDDIIKEMAKKGIIPKPLDQSIQKLYAYRGDQPGVAHGLVGPSKVTVDEAEFVLAMSAAIIIYLAKKRSKT